MGNIEFNSGASSASHGGGGGDIGEMEEANEEAAMMMTGTHRYDQQPPMTSESATQTTVRFASDNNDWERYPLHHAAACGAPIAELARLIDQPGGDVDEIHDETGFTPLHFASMYGQEVAVRWLLKQRRMLSRSQPVRDFQGRTASDLAMQSGFHELARIIDLQTSMAHGASPAHTLGSQQQQQQLGVGPRMNDNVLLQEIDRKNSIIAKLKASEKRVRMELEQEISERIKLFRSLVKSHDVGQEPGQDHGIDLAETMSDMRLQMVEFKAQRDAFAAELKLVELALADLELLVSRTSTASVATMAAASMDAAAATPTPSERLRACLRRI